VTLLALDAPAPDFDLLGVRAGEDCRVSLRSLRGRWAVVFFYPADFSFVCPTEVRGFAAAHERFAEAGATVVGVSPDPPDTHRAWAEELGGIPYPLLSDAGNRVAELYGAAAPGMARPDRATYVVDPDGVLLAITKVARNVGRGVAETLRVLLALQTGRLCPADWQPGDTTGDPGLDEVLIQRSAP
jgi:peroxiredoxin (alkyl hydroperoxide reductase subunit C)